MKLIHHTCIAAAALLTAACSGSQPERAETSATRPATTPAANTSSSVDPTPPTEEPQLDCEQGQFPLQQQQPTEVGATRTIRVEHNYSSSWLVDGARTSNNGRSTISTEVEVVAVTDDYVAYEWRQLLGDNISNFSSHLPPGVGDRIDPDLVITTTYQVGTDGAITRTTTDEDIVSQFEPVHSALHGPDGRDLDTVRADVLASAVGPAILELGASAELLWREVELYHSGVARVLEAPGTTQTEFSLSHFGLGLTTLVPTETEVEMNDECTLMLVLDRGSPGDEQDFLDLASVVLDPGYDRDSVQEDSSANYALSFSPETGVLYVVNQRYAINAGDQIFFVQLEISDHEPPPGW